CYTCSSPGDPELRKCGRCGVARYCSTDCQRANWSSHRELCYAHAEVFDRSDHETVSRVRLFIRWLDHWRDALLSWGVFAADLANQDRHYLTTHWY
ncbi:hypothetical protein DFH06DRAFT_904745, partial [Mycena polygramma]